MNPTLGELLDDPYEFYDWAQGTSVALVVLIATVNSGMLEALGRKPARIEDLAAVVGIPDDKLSRLVSFLAAHGVIALREDGLVERNAATDNLERAAEPLKCIGIGSMSAGTSLLPALRKGITAYEQRHGMPVFEPTPAATPRRGPPLRHAALAGTRRRARPARQLQSRCLR